MKYLSYFHNIQKDKILQSIFLTQLLLSLGWYISTPFIAIYLTTQLSAGIYQAGLFVGLGMLSYSVMSPFAGKLIDDGYIKITIFFSAIFLMISALLFCKIHTLFLAYLISILMGWGRAGFNTLINWSISNYTTQNNRHITFSLRYILINIGSAIGPIISSLFFHGMKSMLFVSFAFYLFSFLTIFPCTAVKPFENTYNVNRKNSNLNLKKLIFLLFGLILFDIFFSQMMVVFPLSIKNAIQNWKLTYSIMFSLNAACVIFLQLPMIKLTNKLGGTLSIFLGSFLASCSFIIFSVASKSSTFYLAIVFFTLSELIFMPLSYVWLDNIAPSGKKGLYFGIYNLTFIGSAVGPVVGGIGAQYFGFQTFYLMLAVLPIIMSVCFLISIKIVDKNTFDRILLDTI